MAMNDTTRARRRRAAAGAAATQVVGAVDGRDATRAMAATEPGVEADDEGPNRTRTYAIILALLVILLLVAGYFLGRNLGYFGGAPSFNLPSVVGQQVAAATTKLQADGLKVATVDQSSTDAPGTVHLHQPATQFAGPEGEHGHPEGGQGAARRQGVRAAWDHQHVAGQCRIHPAVGRPAKRRSSTRPTTRRPGPCSAPTRRRGPRSLRAAR